MRNSHEISYSTFKIKNILSKSDWNSNLFVRERYKNKRMNLVSYDYLIIYRRGKTRSSIKTQRKPICDLSNF